MEEVWFWVVSILAAKSTVLSTGMIRGGGLKMEVLVK